MHRNRFEISDHDCLTVEQKEKAKACKTMEELTALAAKEGVGLPDALLEAVPGGLCIGCCNDCAGDDANRPVL